VSSGSVRSTSLSRTSSGAFGIDSRTTRCRPSCGLRAWTAAPYRSSTDDPERILLLCAPESHMCPVLSIADVRANTDKRPGVRSEHRDLKPIGHTSA